MLVSCPAGPQIKLFMFRMPTGKKRGKALNDQKKRRGGLPRCFDLRHSALSRMPRKDKAVKGWKRGAPANDAAGCRTGPSLRTCSTALQAPWGGGDQGKRAARKGEKEPVKSGRDAKKSRLLLFGAKSMLRARKNDSYRGGRKEKLRCGGVKKKRRSAWGGGGGGGGTGWKRKIQRPGKVQTKCSRGASDARKRLPGGLRGPLRGEMKVTVGTAKEV